ncbi:MAG TPA: cardiolipin synthase [Gemmataceae bacterium]|nr:cardiolipin synthase [Gemmataceae bacterium]
MTIDWALANYITEWLIRLVMLVWVPQRRSPAAARTWLLCIFFFPYAGLLLYWLIGRPYMPRRRIDGQARVSHLIRTVGREHFEKAGYTRPEVKPQFAQAVALAENLGDFGIVGGNSIEFLADYAATIDRLVADIDACHHHAHLLYYIFADDDTGRRVGDALARAVKRGVQCRVLMDFLGSKKSRRTLAPRLREAGIEVHFMLPVGLLRRGTARYDLRNHRKIVVLDGRIGYVGSQNLVNADFKHDLTYEELVARVTGPAVTQLQVVFMADHFFETGERFHEPAYFPMKEVHGTSPAQVLPSGPGYPHANTHNLLVTLIHGARERVVITTPYFIPDSSLLQALQTAALRGVDVHLVVSRQADQVLVGLAQRSYYEELLEGGVKIHLYQRRFLHAKHVSVDDSIALIGSSNMDIRSFRLNAEISLLIYDPQAAAQLHAVQDRYFSNSHLLTLEEWQQRPRLTKIAQNMARLVDSLL